MVNYRPASNGGTSPLKHHIEDSLEEEHAPFLKRAKTPSFLPDQEWRHSCGNEFQIPPSQYNPLDEPSPLGLKLRKTPSLLDLIQTKLYQGNAATCVGDSKAGTTKKEVKGSAAAAASGSIDRLKASNFLASFLKIGSWEYVSRHEGDLVAKCYFAKHKLVWEVLDGGLKSKIEIQWSNIISLKSDFPDDKPGSLTIVLARQPLFFRESNPQPRKHTLWQTTTDFTAGQASSCRQHFLQCPHGILDKHFEKLIQCDMRLNFLSKQPEIVMDSPYFESKDFDDADKFSLSKFNPMDNINGSPISGIQDASLSAAGLSSLEIQQTATLGVSPEYASKEACTASSGVIGMNGNYGEPGSNNLEQLQVPGLRPSMSMSYLVNHIGNHISKQMNPANASECQDILENIAEILLGDNQTVTAADEKSLMSRVNSLCCLLQGPAVVSSGHVGSETRIDEVNGSEANYARDPKPVSVLEETNNTGNDVNLKVVPSSKQSHTMSRKDSLGELLLNLPRIASLPTFLFDISEDNEK